MAARGGVFARMAIGRTVATQGNPALLTGSQMHPGRADGHAGLTGAGCRQRDFTDFRDMRAGFVRHDLNVNRPTLLSIRKTVTLIAFHNRNRGLPRRMLRQV